MKKLDWFFSILIVLVLLVGAAVLWAKGGF